LRRGPGHCQCIPERGGEGAPTDASEVRGELELLKDNLVAICLQGWEDVGGFGQDQVGLVRIALGATISGWGEREKREKAHLDASFLFGQESLVPYCALQLPADHHASLDGAAQDDVVVIPASVELGADIDLAVLVAPDAVWDAVAAVDRGLADDEPGLDGPAPVVDDERVGLDGGFRRF
jgi:hypothetical protein